MLNPDDVPIGFSGLIHPNEAVTDYDTYISADTKVHYFGNYKTRNDDNTIKDINIYGDSVSTTEWGNFYGNTKPINKYSINGLFHIICFDSNDNVIACLFPSNPDMTELDVKKSDIKFPDGTSKVSLNSTNHTSWSNGWIDSNGKTVNMSGYYHKDYNLSNLPSRITNELQYLNCRMYGETQPYTTSDSVTNQIVNNKRIKIKFNMKNKFNTKAGQIELKYIDDIVMNYLTQMIPSTVITEIEYNFCEFTNTDC